MSLKENLSSMPEDHEKKKWGRAGFEVIEMGEYPAVPIFLKSDYEIVRTALRKLPRLDREMIFLRFWKKYDIASIASELGLQAKTVQIKLKRAYFKLKVLCLNHPEFNQDFFIQQKDLSLAA